MILRGHESSVLDLRFSCSSTFLCSIDKGTTADEPHVIVWAQEDKSGLAFAKACELKLQVRVRGEPCYHELLPMREI